MLTGAAYRRLEHRDGVVRLVETRVRDAGTDACRVIVAPAAVGVCRSDLREVRGERHLRRDFGHEIVGAVVACEPDGLIPVGERVVLDPHPPVSRTSGFAELVEISGDVRDVRSAVRPIPNGIPNKRAVFVEPLACASHGLDRLDVATSAGGGDTGAPVGVIGAGTAGVIMAGVLGARGVEAHVFNRGQSRLRFLREREVLPATSLHRLGDARAAGFPRVLLTTASATAELLHAAVRMVADGGLVLVYGGTSPGVALDGIDVDALRRREASAVGRIAGKTVLVVGSHGAVDADFSTATDALDPDRGDYRSFQLALDRMVTVTVPLEDGAHLLNRLSRGEFIGKPVVITSFAERQRSRS